MTTSAQMTDRVTSVDYRHPHRPSLVTLANRAGRLAAPLGLRAELSEHALLAAAQCKAGLQRYGTPGVAEPLRRLVAALEHEARLHPVGRLLVRTNLVRILAHRLRIEQALQAQPEIIARPVARPIFIVGLQRTGTTMLHRLLACDPSLRYLASWEAIHPAPIESPARRLRGLLRRWLGGARPGGPESAAAGALDDPRIRAAALAERSLRYLAPDFFAIHPVQALAPEEDCLLFDYTFFTTVPEATQRVPSYSRWLEEQDMRGAYRYYQRILQYLSWQRPHEGPWLLKTPHHMEHLDALLTVFPGARIIQPHRDPVRTLASFCSMVAHGRGVFSDDIDPHEIGRHWSRKAQRMVERCMAVRDRVGDDSFCDVVYGELVQDPLAQIRRIYAWLGRALQPATEQRMRAWLAANPQHKYGRHRYRLDDFGLDRTALGASFAAYRARFALSAE